MGPVARYLLTGTRGGPIRVQIVRATDSRPRTAEQVAESLDLDRETARHHLDILAENGIVERSEEDRNSYRSAGEPSGWWDTFERNG